MNKRILILTLLILSIKVSVLSQDTTSLTAILGTDAPAREYVTSAFKSTRVINGQSMEFLRPGTMDFRILHRFGDLSNGVKNFFGLDEASMRMGFDFGLKRNLMAGVGRSTLKKELDGYVKYAPLSQSTGAGASPLTIALVAGITVNTLSRNDTAAKPEFRSRLAYYYQAIFGRKFSNALTLQVTPTLVHTNLTPAQQPTDRYAIGLGGRLKFSKRMALTVDYFYRLNGRGANTYDPLSVGVDIETGGHVFQLHFSNATGMNERAYINETFQSWGKTEIRFGFNLSRVFQLRKKTQN